MAVREVYNFNKKWAFSKEACQIPTEIPKKWCFVNLPHTWNGIDGQDGGNDYYRGTAYYAKALDKMDLPKADRYYLEVKGANSSAVVYLNGKRVAEHDGGYSTFRVDITDDLNRENIFVIAVDNSPNDSVYPQMADFTFYGGLYRDVNIICVSETHFELDCFGGNGISITPQVVGDKAKVKIKVWLKNLKENHKLRYTVLDKGGKQVNYHVSNKTEADIEINNVNLWHGRKNPYLYTLVAEVICGDKVLDSVSSRFGCRSFCVDAERGFILNGEEYPLHGVSRHQDWLEIGNALLPEHHEKDMELIMEVGATTVRLAHYQHDQYFYDLCDENGLVVWAEIPYISKHMPAGKENTASQMKELIIQNYNHPSIFFWGLSNEITMNGERDPDLIENHKMLNDLVHSMDKTRLTAIAVVSPCSIDSEYLKIPDLVSYNHYFGWYGGDTSMNGPWFDKFHEMHPDIPIGCSEYGCEALNWHTSTPTQGDYTEEYQAYYHEELIKQLFSRKYIFATHVWNMFDFGADARSEGGENGQNHKGLVTFDRKYKKDAFYAYKAWLSDEPFVHICGKRYIDRVENITRVTVYSNFPEVEIRINGRVLEKKKSSNHFFYFDIPNEGETKIEAIAGECMDTSHIRKVEKFNEAYRLRDKSAILNWFDITEVEGYFSINDKMSDIMKSTEGSMLVGSIFSKFKSNEENVAGFEMNDTMMQMMGGFTLLRLAGMMGTMGINLTKDELLEINRRLNKIKK
jgi:beta-galactosidase